MTNLKLTVNERKTCLRNARQETFDFLGYTFGPMVHRPTGRTYLAARPSRKAMARLRERVRGILTPRNIAPWPEVAQQVNRVVSGWQRYFRYGTVSRAYWDLDKFLLQRARVFLARRHKLPRRGTQRFTAEKMFGEYGLLSLAAAHRAARPHV
jgi:RNA-directed DNA polymerase